MARDTMRFAPAVRSLSHQCHSTVRPTWRWSFVGYGRAEHERSAAGLTSAVIFQLSGREAQHTNQDAKVRVAGGGSG